VTLLKEILEAECSFINTQHKDFIGLQMLSDPTKFKFTEQKNTSNQQNQSQQLQQQMQQQPGGFFVCF
jgi:hypothetical protein